MKDEVGINSDSKIHFAFCLLEEAKKFSFMRGIHAPSLDDSDNFILHPSKTDCIKCAVQPPFNVC
jgi:hypothetical protein